MCGRYFISVEAFPETLRYKVAPLDKKDRCPGDVCDCFIEHQGKIQWVKVPWGIKMSQGMTIINARSESYEQKAFFKGAKRALVLASGFYEWDHQHHLLAFQRTSPTMYMAGLIKRGHLCILTQKANIIMQPIHSRMPVMLEKEEAILWLKGQPLSKRPVLDLRIIEGTHQLSWFE